MPFINYQGRDSALRCPRRRAQRQATEKTDDLPRSFRPAGRGRRSAASLPNQTSVNDIIPGKSPFLTVFRHFSLKLSFFIHGLGSVRRRLNPVCDELNPVRHGLNPLRHGLNPVCDRLNPVGRELKPVRRGLNPIRHELNPVGDRLEPVPRKLNPVSDGLACLRGRQKPVTLCDETFGKSATCCSGALAERRKLLEIEECGFLPKAATLLFSVFPRCAGRGGCFPAIV